MARQRLGQHFLHERATIERLLAAIAPAWDDPIVEIGPGEGALTAPLLERAQRVTAIERDPALAAALAGRMELAERLDVRIGDALAFDFTELAGTGRLRLVGNLPYNISTPLLFHLIDQRGALADMHFMLQREVVERLATAPGSKVYGRLSVMVQAYCQTAALFRVAPGAFRPPPAVDSAVVRVTPRAQPLIEPALQARFAAIVAAAFQARRKTLRNTLRAQLDAEAIAAAGLDPGARPEQLAATDFAALARRAGP